MSMCGCSKVFMPQTGSLYHVLAASAGELVDVHRASHAHAHACIHCSSAHKLCLLFIYSNSTGVQGE